MSLLVDGTTIENVKQNQADSKKENKDKPDVKSTEKSSAKSLTEKSDNSDATVTMPTVSTVELSVKGNDLTKLIEKTDTGEKEEEQQGSELSDDDCGKNSTNTPPVVENDQGSELSQSSDSTEDSESTGNDESEGFLYIVSVVTYPIPCFEL